LGAKSAAVSAVAQTALAPLHDAGAAPSPMVLSAPRSPNAIAALDNLGR